MLKRACIIFICIGIASFCLLPIDAKSREFTLIYTGSLNGYLNYCTCKASPKGGLVKRGTVIKSLRKKKGELLLVDSGDFIPVYGDDFLPKYIMRAFTLLSYDAYILGDQELDLGKKALTPLTKGLPFLSYNVSINGSPLPYPSTKLVKKNGITIGICGIIDPSSFRFSLEETKSSVKVSDPVKWANDRAAELRAQGAEVVLLISHAGFERDKEIEPLLKGIDLITGGHSQTLVDKPFKGKNAYIFQSGPYGAKIGIAQIALTKNGITLVKNEFIHPDMNKPEDDPDVRKLIDEYNKERGYE